MFDPVVLYEDDTWRIVKLPGIYTDLVVEVRRKDALKEPYWKEYDRCAVSGEYATLAIPPPILLKILEFWRFHTK